MSVPDRLVMGVAVGFAVLALAVPASGDPLFRDAGSYRVYQGTQPLGTETFSFEPHGDSILVLSHVQQVLPRPYGSDTLDKNVVMAVAASDFDLRAYQSTQTLNGSYMKRLLVLGDTSFTSYRENERGGVGSRLVRPPGRIFVIDPQAFVLFDVIFRKMHESSIDDRPMTVLFLGIRDTVMDVRARRLGPETIRWGERPVRADKMSLSDSTAEFLAWMSPAGKMLRLTLPNVGLRVERDGPAIKPARKRVRG